MCVNNSSFGLRCLLVISVGQSNVCSHLSSTAACRCEVRSVESPIHASGGHLSGSLEKRGALSYFGKRSHHDVVAAVAWQ